MTTESRLRDTHSLQESPNQMQDDTSPEREHEP